jgi:hypothetical protein
MLLPFRKSTIVSYMLDQAEHTQIKSTTRFITDVWLQNHNAPVVRALVSATYNVFTMQSQWFNIKCTVFHAVIKHGPHVYLSSSQSVPEKG